MHDALRDGEIKGPRRRKNGRADFTVNSQGSRDNRARAEIDGHDNNKREGKSVTKDSIRLRKIAFAAALTWTLGASAQWSSDPAGNLAITNVDGEQVQVKIVARPDGGYFMSWFDNRLSGYDVYVQRLDAAGNPMLAANGVLVADRAFSSTQDYGLSVDLAGNALLAFRDDRSGSTQITATRVNADGSKPWGSNGVQLTTGTAFFAAPKITGTSDGQAVVAWKADNDVRLMRLDAAGAAVLASDVVITDTDGGGGYSVADLNQDCIVNATDLGAFRAVFFSGDADADFDGDGGVNAVDLGILKSGFFLPPGPSGVSNDCDP